MPRRPSSPAVAALITVVLGLAWSHPGAAQTRDAAAHVEKLAEGVYAILHDAAILQWPSGATGWPHGNTGVVVGDAGILVVDSTFLPSRARADIALIGDDPTAVYFWDYSVKDALIERAYRCIAGSMC